MGQSHHQIGKCADRRADEHQSDRFESTHSNSRFERVRFQCADPPCSCRQKVDPETFLSGFRQTRLRVNDALGKSGSRLFRWSVILPDV